MDYAAKFIGVVHIKYVKDLNRKYRIAQNFGGQKLWQIHPSRHFGRKNFGGW